MSNKAEKNNFSPCPSPWFFFCPVQTCFFLFTITIDHTTETPGLLLGGKVSLTFVLIIL